MRISFFISGKFARHLLLAMAVVTLGFTALSLLFEMLNHAARTGDGAGRMQLFDLDADQNVPTWYSASLLLICAVLLAAIAAVASGIHRLYWGGLSVGFLYLSADEAASIHEKVRPVLGGWLNAGSFTDYIWVVLYGPVAAVLTLAYLGFLRGLPSETRRLFLFSGLVYVGGALGMEVVGGLYASLYGTSNLAYFLLTHAEELLEMLGVIVFVYALLLHVSLHVQKLEIGVKHGA